ncbi:MAG: tetratricopeptide repeat protein [Spartobacteria bacterium]
MKLLTTAAILGTASLAFAGPLDDAREALDNGFAQVALVKMEEHQPNLGKAGSSPAECLLYARALFEANQPGAAIEFLKTSEVDLGAEGRFWLAQAHAANSDWPEALDAYSLCLAQPDFIFRHEALIGRARMLQNLDRKKDAEETLAPAIDWPESPLRTTALQELAGLFLDRNDSNAVEEVLGKLQPETSQEKTRQDFLLARLAILRQDNDLALKLLAPLVPSNAAMASECSILHATALARSGRGQEAENLLEEFIAANPNAPGLERVFAELEKAYSNATSVSTSELKRWSEDEKPTLRRKLATYYLAGFEARQKNPQGALVLLEKLSTEPGTNPFAEETLLDLAALRLRLGLTDETLSVLPPAGGTPETNFLRGLALANKSRFLEASAAFLSLANDPVLAEPALYNAALCEMLVDAQEKAARAALEARFPQSRNLSALKLQEAFQQVRGGKPEAGEVLKSLANSQDSQTAAKARLALAEWKFQQLDTAGSRLELEKISNQPEMPRQAALRVFLADSGEPGSEEAAIDEARAFLLKHPDSESEPEVRLKLGELLYRKGDFAAARVELEALARKFPDNPNEKPALFLAAKAAARIPTADAPDAAMLLFEEVASEPGPLAHRARLEQAGIQSARGKATEANTILDKILATDPSADMKASALMEKGKNLYTIGDTDPLAYKSAIEVWKQIAMENPDPKWKNQALARIGTAQEKMGDLNAALASYYEVFKPSAEAPEEFFWFYKAGFAAAMILESRKEWPEAIRVYEQMASIEGPRALEAKNRIKQIRLENFIWDGN